MENPAFGARERKAGNLPKAPGAAATRETFRKWAVGKKAAPAAKATNASRGTLASANLPHKTAHIPFNPLVGGGEAEHNFVIFQRLQLDSSKGRAGAVSRRDPQSALATQDLVHRINLRKEIDLSYLPDGQREREESEHPPSGGFLEDLGNLFWQRGRERRPVDTQDATLGRLKAQVEHIRKWGEALHENDFLPATLGRQAPCFRGPSPASPVPYPDVPLSNPLAGAHARDCENFAELNGLTCGEIRKRERERRKQRQTAGPEAVQWFLKQGAWSCAAGPEAVPQPAAGGLRRPIFMDPADEPMFALRRPEALADVEEVLREAEDAGRKKAAGDSLELDLDSDEQRELEQMLAENEGFATDACHVDVKAMAQFFDIQRVPPSQRVKMLELDCRSFLIMIKKLQTAKACAEEKLQQARKEKEAMAKDIAAREARLKQTEAAVRLALKDHLRIQRSLQATVKAGSEIIEEEQKKVAIIKRSETRLTFQVEEAAQVAEQQAEEIQALKQELAEVKKKYEEYEKKMFIDNKAYHEDQIKLEKFHYRCLSLGEDRLRLLEALRREKANLDIRCAELVLYKQELEDVTEDRRQIKDSAGRAQHRMMQDQQALQKKLKQETEKRNRVIQAKDKELEALREQKLHEEKQVDRYRSLCSLRLREMKKMRNIIDMQQSHLKEQSSNYQEFLKNIMAFQGKLTVLGKLARNIRAFYAEHGAELGGGFGAALPDEAGADRRDSSSRGPSTADGKGESVRRASHMQASVTQDAIKSQFDAASKGAETISVDQAAEAARKLGLAPSLAEIESLRSAAENSRVDRAAFAAFCDSAAHEDEASQLASFFKVWDPKEKGTIPKGVAKNLLQSFGEPLTPEEADFAIHLLADDAETVNYRDFCEKLVALVPRK
uniref:Myosin light chain 3, related n=1 Tax=Neospora caninum (strain Liverpool) TaxID=572307 RepID=A0A0F7UR80_NEOCL|nr:TPA: Myosin light chain 3, related [Neospora caninum Liverpool]